MIIKANAQDDIQQTKVNNQETLYAILQQAKANDQEALYKLWDLYKPLCESWARKTYLQGWDREDLIQQSYLILLETVAKYELEGGMPFGGYYKVRLSIWRSRQLRKKQDASSNVESVERAMLQAGSLKDEVESQVEDQLIATMIAHQLQYLTQGEAEVLQACLIEGQELSRLCQHFGLTLEGLKSRRKRGLKKLKDRAKLAGII